MKQITEIIEALELKVLVSPPDIERKVTGGYAGDLLSWVMSRAPEDCAWFTVMGNVNAIAVAVLADISLIVLCENAALDEDARKKAEEKGIGIAISDQTAYALSAALWNLLEGSRHE